MHPHARYKNLHILSHPLIQHKLTHLRMGTTSTNGFRRLLREVGILMGYEITRDLGIGSRAIETPLASMNAPILVGKKVALVSVLRAGLGMAEGLRELIPSAREGHIGIYRDEKTLEPKEYYVSLPSSTGRRFILVDPMLATGHTASLALKILNDHGVPDEQIRFLCLVAAPEGVEYLEKHHPRVAIYCASLDSHLNEHGFIVPGLGDAGNRLFGTK